MCAIRSLIVQTYSRVLGQVASFDWFTVKPKEHSYFMVNERSPSPTCDLPECSWDFLCNTIDFNHRLLGHCKCLFNVCYGYLTYKLVVDFCFVNTVRLVH